MSEGCGIGVRPGERDVMDVREHGFEVVYFVVVAGLGGDAREALDAECLAAAFRDWCALCESAAFGLVVGPVCPLACLTAVMA